MQTPLQHLSQDDSQSLPLLAPFSANAPDVQQKTDATAAMDRNELVLLHLPSVRYVARKIKESMPQHVDLEELISAGTLGLLDAAAKFNPARDVQFKSYAQFRIRGAILDSLRGLDWSPRELRRQGRAIAAATRALSVALGRVPSEAEIAESLHMDLSSFQLLSGELKSLEIGSLQEERVQESEETELDFLTAPERENPEALCVEGQTRAQIAAAIEGLPERERLVLTLYYYEELTLKEIGTVLGVVESRVSQIRGMAIARLRKQLMKRPAGRLTA